jgi:hypothetical protein
MRKGNKQILDDKDWCKDAALKGKRWRGAEK